MKKIKRYTFFLLLMPGAAFAHEEGIYASFEAGISHPVLGLDHLLAMVSVGVISHQMGGRAILAVPTTFVGVMALGGILGMINMVISCRVGNSFISFRVRTCDSFKRENLQ